MSVPIIVDDGNFKAPHQISPWEFEYPFASENDDVSFIARRTMRVDADYFFNPVRTTETRSRGTLRSVSDALQVSPAFALGRRTAFRNKGYAYLCDATPSRAISDSSGLLDYVEVWSSIPARRITYETISYEEQYITRVDGETSIFGIPKSTNAKVIWDYALGPLRQLKAPRIFEAGGHFYGVNGWGEASEGDEVLAVDSENSIYIGPIYQRRAIYVTYSGYQDVTLAIG